MTPFPPNKLNDDDRILRIHTREYVTPTSSSSHPGARKVKLQVKNTGITSCTFITTVWYNTKGVPERSLSERTCASKTYFTRWT